MAFWKARHLPGLRLTANGTQNDKAEAGSIPVLTTKIKKTKTYDINYWVGTTNKPTRSQHLFIQR